MTHERDETVQRMLRSTQTRRRVLKSAIAAGTGALALPAIAPFSPATRASARAKTLFTREGDEMLPREKLTIHSTIAVNLTRSFATAPLFEGTFNGQPAWYIITDASDEGMASDLGVNFAPRLANIPVDSPTVQHVMSGDPILGRDMVTFAGVPDFSPTRLLLGGPMATPCTATSCVSETETLSSTRPLSPPAKDRSTSPSTATRMTVS
jgi:hypothetical protein